LKSPTPVSILPGLALVLGVAWMARAAHGRVPPDIGRLVGEVIFAVLFGLIIANVLRLPKLVQPGIAFAFKTLLRAAIVLLGATFSFFTALSIGGRALLMVVGLMSLALLAAHALGRLLGVPGKVATLIGVGTAVCGNTAISAVAPVIGARDEETSFAIATNTLFGTLAVFAYPVLGHALGMSHAAFGTWAGTAVNDTSQVVATGFAFSQSAGSVATVVKLTRNMLMGGVIILMGLIYAGGGQGTAGSLGSRLKQSVPVFVLGFLGMCLLNTFGVVAWASQHAGRDLIADAQTAAKALILMALAGVGLATVLGGVRDGSRHLGDQLRHDPIPRRRRRLGPDAAAARMDRRDPGEMARLVDRELCRLRHRPDPQHQRDGGGTVRRSSGGADLPLSMWTLMTVLAMLVAPQASLSTPANVWAEPTRGILAQRCGQCHVPNLPTSVPRALVVFDLTADPWYGRLTHDQLDDLLRRIRSVKSLPESDLAIVESFVRCARDLECAPSSP
jgi:uncharacterized integral membrane protein (TIGR00698 family)